jgi:hypothetical protein
LAGPANSYLDEEGQPKSSISWEKVADTMGGVRSPLQCRQKWAYDLGPKALAMAPSRARKWSSDDEWVAVQWIIDSMAVDFEAVRPSVSGQARVRPSRARLHAVAPQVDWVALDKYMSRQTPVHFIRVRRASQTAGPRCVPTSALHCSAAFVGS